MSELNTQIANMLELHKQVLDAFDKRRSYEWKMSLALWGGIGALTGFLFPHRTELGDAVSSKELLAIYIVIAIFYAFVWAAPVAMRQQLDHDCANHYRQYVELQLLGVSCLQSTRTPLTWCVLLSRCRGETGFSFLNLT